MNKTEMVSAIRQKVGLTEGQARNALEVVLHSIMSEVKAGKKVAIPSFGTFSVQHRKARNGRNPQTGKPIKIAASKTARFSVGKLFKDVVNGKALPKLELAPTPSTKPASTKKAASAPAKKTAPKKVAAKKPAAKKAPAKKAAKKR